MSRGDRKAPLSAREEGFAKRVAIGRQSFKEAYVGTYNVTNPNAAWVPLEGYRVSQRPNVAQRISELNEEAARAAGATREWALSGLKETADRAFQEGQDDSWANDAKAGIAAVRLIADMCGWIPRGTEKDVDGEALKAELLAKLASLDPETLRAMAARPVNELTEGQA